MKSDEKIKQCIQKRNCQRDNFENVDEIINSNVYSVRFIHFEMPRLIVLSISFSTVF